MGLVKSVSVIFGTEATYSCYFNKGDFVDIEDKMFPRNFKFIARGFYIPGFGIVKYDVRSESGRIIAIQDHAYYVPGLPKDLCIISPQDIRTSEGYKVAFVSHCCYEHDIYEELNLKEDKPGWHKAKPVYIVNINYDPKNNPPTHEDIIPNQT